MNTSVINEIRATMVASYILFFFGLNGAFSADMENLIPNKTITVVEESFIGSINIYANALSCLSVGYLVNKMGRKNIILLALLLNLTGYTIMTFFLFNIETVYVGRIFCGTAVGLRGATVIYVGEISHKNRRGKLLALMGLMASIGTSVAYLIQYFFSSKMLTIVGFTISLVGSIQAYFLYETKYYLLMKNDLKEAQNSMLWFDQTMTLDEVHQEIEEIQVEQERVKGGASIFRLFQHSSTIKSLIICLLIMILRTGGSVRIITAYPHEFYSLFLLPVSINNMTLIQGVIDLIFSMGNILVMDTRPRKFMLHLCCWIEVACLIIFCFQMTLVETMSKVGVLVVFFALIVYWGILTGFLMDLTILCVTEIASSNSEFRAIIFSVVQFIESLFLGVHANFFPQIMASLPSKWIFIFMACFTAGLSLVICYVPETRGKALHRCDWQESEDKQNYLLVETSDSDIATNDEDS